MRKEIRKLTAEDMEQASQLSRFVYDSCLRGTVSPENTVFFENYIKKENLIGEIEAGRLHVWGISNEQYLIAVCGMTSGGLITMLYVLPRYQRQKLGRKLVYHMRKYARTELDLPQIVVNAVPSWTKSYFERCGFRQTDYRQNASSPFVTLDVDSVYLKEYPRKHIRPWVKAAVIAACAAACTITAVGYSLYMLL